MVKSIEERRSISLPELKRQGYFGRHRSGVIRWGTSDQVTSSVGVVVFFERDNPQAGGTLTLEYTYAQQVVELIFQMVYGASNLRRGGVWYLICPVTGRRCRTLYESESTFVSRYVEGGLLYRSQLDSHKDRAADVGRRQLKKLERRIKLVDWLIKPYSKRYYAGKPTRPMLRYLREK